MKPPKVILDLHKHRREVLCLSEEFDINEPSISEESIGTIITGDNDISLGLSEDVDGVKERTNHALMQLYREQGYDVFRKNAILLKDKGSFDDDKYGTFKGELAEVFLYTTILEFIKEAGVDWLVMPSIVIPHKNGKPGATTEVDLILVSEQLITVFEAKSYNGAKSLTGACTMEIKNRDSMDIYGQNSLHCESLIKQIKHLNSGTGRGMKSVLFSFASGTLVDRRDTKAKALMPVLDEETLLEYLISLLKVKDKNWVSNVKESVKEICSRLTIEDHKKYRNYK